ncbi:MAG: hypothetical protein HQ509_00600 [Candidatus Marinimicrobia bacterium]|nr:hypothetical protein [Candidatus Neomarinimicrobiota bacterium]
MQQFETTDFYLAAYFLFKGIKLVEHKRSQAHSTFIFEGPELEDLSSQFYLDQILIPPMAFAKAIRSLKNIMYNTTSHQTNSTSYEHPGKAI